MVNLISSIESRFMMNKNKPRFMTSYILARGYQDDIPSLRIDKFIKVYGFVRQNTNAFYVVYSEVVHALMLVDSRGNPIIYTYIIF